MTKNKEFYHTFLELALALMLQQAVVLSVNLADNVMLGSYSETALSGVAAVNQIQFVLQQAVSGITNGMIIVASQYWGQKRTKPIKKLMSIAFWLNICAAALLFTAVSIWPHGTLSLFTKEENIIAEGMGYLSIVKFSYLFFACTTLMLGGMRLVKKVKIAFTTSIIALIINCSINYTLIKGHFGMPALGARGAAIGTLTARIIEFFIVGYYVFRKDELLNLNIMDLIKVKLDLLSGYLKVMLPLFIDSILWGLNTAMQTVILGHMSASAIAAHSISSTIFLFLKVTSVGAANASSVIIGRTIGEGNIERVKEYVRTLQVMFVGIGTGLMLILLAIRAPLLSFYVLAPETFAMAQVFIVIEAIVLFLTSYQMCMNVGIICGGGDSTYLMWVDIIGVWAFSIPLSFLAAFVWKLSPVWVLILLNIDQLIKCIPAFIYGNSFRWIKTLTQ